VRRVNFLLFIALAACAPAVQSVMFVSPAPSPRAADHPIRFYGSTRPECPFEEVGTVRARKPNSFVSMEAVAESIRERARSMGGDAVIGVGEATETRGASLVGSAVVLNRDPVVSGTVIRFTNAACAR
jgi:hypothetical protein